MGALHAGHEALIMAADRDCDTVVASLFVNPAQFDEDADLAYPRDEARDAEFAAAAGADVLFVPEPDEIYPPGFQTWVEVELSRGLEGEHRPGHFRGVATICLKLFNIVQPRAAYFGQKDAQQLAVIRRLVRDLNLDIEIRSVATVRDADGLALCRATRSSPRSARPRWRRRGAATRDAAAARATLAGLPGWPSTTSRWPTSTRPSWPPPSVSAVPV